MLEQPVLEAHSGRVIPVAAVCEELLLTGETHIGGVHGELSPAGGTPCCSRRRMPLAEQQQKHTMD